MVDYSKKEVVQFEDDDYYYYVKAIPKMGKKEEKEKTPAKKVGERKPAADKGAEVAERVRARREQEPTE